MGNLLHAAETLTISSRRKIPLPYRLLALALQDFSSNFHLAGLHK